MTERCFATSIVEPACAHDALRGNGAEQRGRWCLGCGKARSLCVCGSVPQVPNRTRVVILQHPRERRHALGTVRLLELGLRRCEVHVAWQLARAPLTLPTSLAADAALLWPDPAARTLPSRGAGTLVVLDGTWHQAKVLRRTYPELDGLPAVRLQPTAPSRYRLRREPAPHCLSTVEAVVLALRALEPELQGLEALLQSFDSMIEAQARFVEARLGRRGLARARPERQRVLPRALVERYDDLVIVEPERGSAGATGRLHLHRPRTELRATWAGPSAGPPPAWATENAVLACWSEWSARAVVARGFLPRRPPLVLRSVWRRARPDSPGTLLEIAESEGLWHDTGDGPPSAGRRVDLIASLVHRLRVSAGVRDE